MVEQGNTEDVVRRYLASVDKTDLGRRRWEDPNTRPGNALCRLVEVRVTDEAGEPGTIFMSSQPIVVTVEFDLARKHSSLAVQFDLFSADNSVVFRSSHTDAPESSRPRLVLGRNAAQCVIPPGLLNSGRFSVGVQIQLHSSEMILHEQSVLSFDVIADHGESLSLNTQGRPGVIAPILPWSAVEPVADDGSEERPVPVSQS